MIVEAGSKLFEAIRNRDEAAWCEALAVEGAAQERDAMGRSVIHRVALSRDAPAKWMRQAFDRGALLEQLDLEGWTALQIACKRGRADAVEALVDLGADTSAVVKISKGYPRVRYAPAQIAAAYGRMEAYEALAKKLSGKLPCNGEAGRPIFLAAVFGCHEMVKSMVESGVAMKKAKIKGMREEPSLLSVAVMKKHKKVFDALMELGAPIEEAEKGRGGVRAMHVAAASPDASYLKALLKKGAQIDPQTSTGWTPLHVACEKDKAANVEMLLAAGADPRKKTERGRTAAQVAAHHNSIEALEALIKRDPDLATEPDGEGKRALDLLNEQSRPRAESLVLFSVTTAPAPGGPSKASRRI